MRIKISVNITHKSSQRGAAYSTDIIGLSFQKTSIFDNDRMKMGDKHIIGKQCNGFFGEIKCQI